MGDRVGLVFVYGAPQEVGLHVQLVTLEKVCFLTLPSLQYRSISCASKASGEQHVQVLWKFPLWSSLNVIWFNYCNKYYFICTYSVPETHSPLHTDTVIGSDTQVPFSTVKFSCITGAHPFPVCGWLQVGQHPVSEKHNFCIFSFDLILVLIMLKIFKFL